MVLLTKRTSEGSNYVKYKMYHYDSMVKAGYIVVYDNGNWKAYNVDNKEISCGIDADTTEAFNSAKVALQNYLNETKVIWFNFGWFSSLSTIINGIHKEFGNKIKVLGTSPITSITYKELLDIYDSEPDHYISPQEYVDFALDMCKKHNVSIFFPKKYMQHIASSKQRFAKIGVKVVCERSDVIELINSKQQTYQVVGEQLQELVPTYKVVGSLYEFKLAYNEIQAISQDNKVVIKYDVDEGASSFRVIDDGAFDCNNLKHKHENTLSSSEAFKIIESLEESGKFKPLIIIEYLDDPEISVDCYMSKSHGLQTIVRLKKTSRIKQIVADGELYNEVREYCRKIQKLFKLKTIFNIQFRYVEGKLKLLEINTRMSGGIHIAYPIEVFMPNLLIGEELGLDVHTNNSRNALISQYETPILIE